MLTSTLPSAAAIGGKGWLGSVAAVNGWKKTRTLSQAGRFSLAAVSRSSHVDIHTGPRSGRR